MPPKELEEAQEVLLDGASLNGAGTSQPTTRYLRRWYMLLIYSSLACLQGWQWSVPGGIGTSLEGIYGINDVRRGRGCSASISDSRAARIDSSEDAPAMCRVSSSSTRATESSSSGLPPLLGLAF